VLYLFEIRGPLKKIRIKLLVLVAVDKTKVVLLSKTNELKIDFKNFNMKAGSPLPRRLSSRQVGDESRQPQQSKFNRKLYIL